MQLGLTALLLGIASYFLAAAFVSRIRIRWGKTVSASITLSRSGAERSTSKHLKPRMGTVTCLGIAVFVGGLAVGGLAAGNPVRYMIAGGFVLMTVGALLDWLREPPTYTKR